jgi:hypothetical protein
MNELKRDIITILEKSEFYEFYLIIKEIYETVLFHLFQKEYHPNLRKINKFIYGFYGFSYREETYETDYETLNERKRWFNKYDKKVIIDNIKSNITFDIIRQNQTLLKSIIQFH